MKTFFCYTLSTEIHIIKIIKLLIITITITKPFRVGPYNFSRFSSKQNLTFEGESVKTLKLFLHLEKNEIIARRRNGVKFAVKCYKTLNRDVLQYSFALLISPTSNLVMFVPLI